ncbi:hypothetical protein L218DRAFT_948725 [Marasmius fiardii PR-910]|nr:hypothetical protein L218DRAFT_948725 [Marasmius fiardii PR-910]
MADTSLTPTFGIWLISLFLESMFSSTFDAHTVTSLMDLEILQSSGLLSVLCLSAEHAPIVVHLAKTSKSVLWIITGTIVLLILLEFAAGIGAFMFTDIMIKTDPVILQQRFSQVTTFAALSTVKDMTSLQSAAAFVVDSIITICLVALLRKGKSEIKQTNDMLDTLILYAINRGFLTAACALINLVLFLAILGKFYFFLGLVCSSKSCLLPPNLIFIGGDSVDWNSILATTNRSQFAVPSVPIFPSHGIITVNEEALELQDTSGKQVSGVHSNGKEGQQKMSIG